MKTHYSNALVSALFLCATSMVSCKPQVESGADVEGKVEINTSQLSKLAAETHPKGFMYRVSTAFGKNENHAIEAIIASKGGTLKGQALGRPGVLKIAKPEEYQNLFQKMAKYSERTLNDVRGTLRNFHGKASETLLSKQAAIWHAANEGYRKFFNDLGKLHQFHLKRLRSKLPAGEAELAANQLKNESIVGMMFHSWGKTKAKEAEVHLNEGSFFKSLTQGGGGCNSASSLRVLALGLVGIGIAAASYELSQQGNETSQVATMPEIEDDLIFAMQEGHEEGEPSPVASIYSSHTLEEAFDMKVPPSVYNATQMSAVLYATDDEMPVFDSGTEKISIDGESHNIERFGGLNELGRHYVHASLSAGQIVEKFKKHVSAAIHNLQTLGSKEGLAGYSAYDERLNKLKATQYILNKLIKVNGNSAAVDGKGATSDYLNFEKTLNASLKDLMAKARTGTSHD